MNTASIKKIAQQARILLKQGVEQRLLMHGYNPKTKTFAADVQLVAGGAIKNGELINDPLFFGQWQALQQAVKKQGIDIVAEEAAYTWFNRLMAIRILAKNGYITPQLEYVSSMLQTPMIVQTARQGSAPKMDAPTRTRLDILLADDSLETELFTLLITHYCRTNDLLQRLFGRIDDYTELLLPTDILAQNGFIHLLNTSEAISDEDYQQVELIGWLYQFYISEKKDEVFASFRKKKKAEAEDIPAATQIFTPNWIVKYMVQNTVGRLWLDLKPDDTAIRDKMEYLVENPDVQSAPIIAEVVDMRVMDPACGSGHILVEAFDLLYDMYRTEGYSAREAVETLLKQNLYGLDLDLRAVQLARFALLLKAARYYRGVLQTDLMPHIYAMPEADEFTPQEVSDFLGEEGKTYTAKLTAALTLMQQAQNLGSIMKFTLAPEARNYIADRIKTVQYSGDAFREQLWQRLTPYLQVLLALTQSYHAVAANPPYMGSGNMNTELKNYINRNYLNSKSDLFAVFMEVCTALNVDKGRMGMINMHSWMFLSSYEKLRKIVIDNFVIDNMLHLGPRTFDELSGEVVQNTAFILIKAKPSDYKGVYYRLVDGNNSTEKQQLFLNGENRYAHISQSNFEKIPGSPIAYWVSERVAASFSQNKIIDFFKPRKGLVTMNDKLFIRAWYEVVFTKIGFNQSNVLEFDRNNFHFAPFKSGGGFRRWYGNRIDVINWFNDGFAIKKYITETSGDHYSRQIFNQDKYFLEGVSWNSISSRKSSFRYYEEGFIFGSSGPSLFPLEKTSKEKAIYTHSLLNSCLTDIFIKIINPTFNFGPTIISGIPLIVNNATIVVELTKENIDISKTDWDSRETSWDFENNPLVALEASSVEQAYSRWEEQVTCDFYQLHSNEVELNRLFIDIYGLQEELTPDVKLQDITILQEELDKTALGDSTQPLAYPLPLKRNVVMSQLVSYFVGCAMGRYRLDKPGLHIAHPAPSAEETAPYSYRGKTFAIEPDAILPLMPADCGFADNALNRVKELLALVWGEENIIPTINFVEDGLDKPLETYMIRDFWKEHCKRYQNRPIYWLFSSPSGAFQVLVYMHRMSRHTVEQIRSRYLLRYIGSLDSRIQNMRERENELTTAERRVLERLQRDIQECREYEMQLRTVADSQIEFDLDDGVKVNYEKFEEVVRRI